MKRLNLISLVCLGFLNLTISAQIPDVRGTDFTCQELKDMIQEHGVINVQYLYLGSQQYVAEDNMCEDDEQAQGNYHQAKDKLCYLKYGCFPEAGERQDQR